MNTYFVPTHTITHVEHTEDYFKGFESMKEKIQAMGLDACLSEFNSVYPIGYKPSSLAAYYYAKGEVAALQG